MNSSDSLSLVQGPSTVTCMIHATTMQYSWKRILVREKQQLTEHITINLLVEEILVWLI